MAFRRWVTSVRMTVEALRLVRAAARVARAASRRSMISVASCLACTSTEDLAVFPADDFLLFDDLGMGFSGSCRVQACEVQNGIEGDKIREEWAGCAARSLPCRVNCCLKLRRRGAVVKMNGCCALPWRECSFSGNFFAHGHARLPLAGANPSICTI